MSDDLNRLPSVGGSQDSPYFHSLQQKRRSVLIFSFDEVPELPKIGSVPELPKIGSRYERNEDLLKVFKQKVVQLQQDVSDSAGRPDISKRKNYEK